MYLLTTVSTVSFASEVCKTDSDDMLSQLLLNHPSIKMSQEAVKGAKYKYWTYNNYEYGGRQWQKAIRSL